MDETTQQPSQPAAGSPATSSRATDSPAASPSDTGATDSVVVADLAESKQSTWKKLDNPYLILFTMFFVTGATGLPLIWVSRSFSPLMKVVWSIVVTLYTALIIYLTYLVVMWSWAQASQALKLL